MFFEVKLFTLSNKYEESDKKKESVALYFLKMFLSLPK